MKTIPFFSLEHQHRQIREQVQQKLMSVYDRGRFIQAQELDAFEQEYARYTGVNHVVGVGNGLDALTICLMACKIGPGDEVIVPAHTYFATWLAVTRVGAVPVPVEPDPATLNIDVTKIEEKITSRTRAIVPVHLYGQSCNMEAIKRIALKHRLKVVEDNAQAQGSSWAGKPTGSWGDVNATSFYPTKNIGALGDGGAITTDDAAAETYCRQIGNYGFHHKNVASRLGLNSRLDEIQAAVLRVKLSFVSSWIQERRKLALMYLDCLKGTPDLTLPGTDPAAFHTYHQFVVCTADDLLRDRLRLFLNNHNIETSIHYPLAPHRQQPYQYLNYERGSFPLTEKLMFTVLSLPLWVGMTADDVEYVSQTIRRALT